MFTIKKEETSFLKGIAIIFVLIGHFVPPFFPYSEVYIPIKRLISQVGVGIFMFLSGYGVMISYIQSSQGPLVFLKRRLLKLWPLYFAAISFYALFQIFLFHENVSREVYIAHLLGLQVYLGYEDLIYSASHFISGLMTVYVVVSLSMFFKGNTARLIAAGLFFLLYGVISLTVLHKLYFIDYISSFVAGMFVATWTSSSVNRWSSLLLLCYTVFIFQYPYNAVKFTCTILSLLFLLLLAKNIGYDSRLLNYLSLLGVNSYSIYLSHNFFVWKWPALIDIFGSVPIVGFIIIVSTVSWMGFFFVMARFFNGYVTRKLLYITKPEMKES